MNLFSPPPETPFTFLSLGAGVQSSCLALMAAKGKIGPMPDAAIFADTQGEPESVYRWLDWLTMEIQRSAFPFPVIRVTQGELAALELRLAVNKRGQTYRKTAIPAFARNPDGSVGLVSRNCTYDFKIVPILRYIRKAAMIRRGQKEVTVTQWIGISRDELQRVKRSPKPWLQNHWPLLERSMTRRHCLEWMADNSYPVPPRSSCSFCPFHSNFEWVRMRDEEPEAFAAAVEFERAMQAANEKDEVFRSIPYLHRSCVPLDQVDFSTDIERGQGAFDFQSECEGMCGV